MRRAKMAGINRAEGQLSSGITLFTQLLKGHHVWQEEDIIYSDSEAESGTDDEGLN